MNEKRVHPRVSLSQTASVTSHGHTIQALVANLSRGGAFLKGIIDLPYGTGVRISFRLATGLPVVLNGKVVRSAPDHGLGVQFFDMDDITHEILNDYLGAANFAPTSDTLSAEVTVKYRFVAAKERFDLALLGYLERHDCTRLRELLDSELTTLKSKSLVLVVDASHFVCCSPEGLKEFRSWLDKVRASHQILGGLIGPRTVGVLQLRRIVREAQIADSFMGFETTAEADEVLKHLSV